MALLITKEELGGVTYAEHRREAIDQRESFKAGLGA